MSASGDPRPGRNGRPRERRLGSAPIIWVLGFAVVFIALAALVGLFDAQRWFASTDRANAPQTNPVPPAFGERPR